MTLRTLSVAAGLLAGLAMFDVSAAFANGTRATLFAVLSGGAEVSSTTGAANVGDPDGFGTGSVTIGKGVLCYSIVVHDIDTPIMAHIHRAPVGVNGPIVVNLAPPAEGAPGTSSACIEGLDPVLLREIRNRPWEFYFNVHTADFPPGAVRGQLF